jgi:hypothetical protein
MSSNSHTNSRARLLRSIRNHTNPGKLHPTPDEPPQG